MLQRTILAAMLLVESLSVHIASNNSDVIVTYAGHAEANREANTWKNTALQHENSKTTEEDPALSPDPNFKPTEPDDVVFVPNEKQILRNEDRYHEDVKISDVLNTNRRSLGDIAAQAAAAETEGPAENILFVSGKNNDNTEYENKKNKKEIQQKKDTLYTGKSRKLNCDNLDCNNTVKSVCGGKIEHNKWKYRLFLNDCYFKKVNCGFRYDNNSESDSELERERERVEEIRVMSRLYRIPLPIAYSRHLSHMLRAARSEYIRVKSENCRNTGEHYATPPPSYSNPLPAQIVKPDNSVSVRNATSRRSLHLMMDGAHCNHPCPVSCTNDYAPECAVTQTGERRVFVNHCKLDYNSCSNGIYWRKRPMSECVGGKKADMHQNSAFITWMRQAGIVDKKGRLVLRKT